MNLQEIINHSDMILVGIGEDFQEKFEKVKVEEEEKNTIFEEYSRKKYLENKEKEEIEEAYDKLALLLKEKNYFIITLCNDDKIYKADLKKDRIVAPCGTYQALQCTDVCTEDIYPFEEYEKIIAEKKVPLCPHCGKPLTMNHVGTKKYSEEGYLKQWNLYTKWLQGTLNKQVCILELGVGMKYPSVIRWPFEKVAFLNNKATFIRVHGFLHQLTEEIKEKGVSIQENPVTFLRNQIV